MERRVLCISDSLGLPRPGVPYGDTWYGMLRGRRPEVEWIADFRRNATTDTLSAWDYGEHLTFYRPEAVVIQLGICDCAPRYLPTHSLAYRLIGRLPSSLSGMVWKGIRTFRRRSVRRADVPPERFRANLAAYLDRCAEAGVERVLGIRIAVPAEAMVRANPTVREAVALYNGLLAGLAERYPFYTLAGPLDEPLPKYYTEDGYHPCRKGNERVADAVDEWLR